MFYYQEPVFTTGPAILKYNLTRIIWLIDTKYGKEHGSETIATTYGSSACVPIMVDREKYLSHPPPWLKKTKSWYTQWRLGMYCVPNILRLDTVNGCLEGVLPFWAWWQVGGLTYMLDLSVCPWVRAWVYSPVFSARIFFEWDKHCSSIRRPKVFLLNPDFCLSTQWPRMFLTNPQ